ncbi:5-oxoprolinase subunit PxpB [Simiduia curdlanivorans]|uniref:5-oxoprolinase subunit PxpB n=1 Tax=Simiduia curdlanivorans TaxID=1492769 RepID=A0ABV8V033_9GAMM|nr:5-oxoprolinase subunit PxpB [Simiduia curdlanivorans]MDN3638107.1 5-oxoprolinase subunit PxpB [Simiduia curdlanivorans]
MTKPTAADQPQPLDICIAGSNAVIVYFAHSISEAAASQVAALTAQLKRAAPAWLIDLVPSYSSLLVVFNPLTTDPLAVKQTLRACATQNTESHQSSDQIVRLPVYYSEASGPDLANLAERAKLSIAEVIEIHTASTYRVYAIGFAPGFAYLGEVDERIAAPRLSTPRTKVPKGAVAIADRQTAVYPAESPGGWNLIGRCPTPMFKPTATPTMPVQSGDLVQFYAIDEAEYLALGGKL